MDRVVENYIIRNMFEQGNYQDSVNIFENKDVLEEIPEIYSEALVLQTMATAMFSDERHVDRREYNLGYMKEYVEDLSEFQKMIVKLRCYFFYERKLYERNNDTANNNDGLFGYIDTILRDNVNKKAEDRRKRNVRYPIRVKIHDICMATLENISVEVLMSFSDYGNQYERILEIKNRFLGLPKKNTWGYWYRKVKIIDDFLSVLHSENLGSTGHLLWMCLYFSELIYYKTDEVRTYSLTDNLQVNVNLLDDLYGRLESIQIKSQQNVENEIMMCYSRTYTSDVSFSKEMNRVRGILGRDITLRNCFVDKKTNGVKSRCYAILTNGTDKWVAISGYDNSKYNLCKYIFDKYANGKYKVVEPALYPQTRYMVNIVKNIKYIDDKDRDIHSYFVQNAKRMFSCAERRLGNIYLNQVSLSERKSYKLLVRWEPCYMCRDFVNIYGINYVGFEKHFDLSQKDKNKYDYMAKCMAEVKSGLEQKNSVGKKIAKGKLLGVL